MSKDSPDEKVRRALLHKVLFKHPGEEVEVEVRVKEDVSREEDDGA